MPDVNEVDLSRKEIAAVLNLTPQRIDQLVKEGVIEKSGRGRYPLVGSVHAYIRSLKSAMDGQTKRATSNRAQEARAAEIERRMAREDREIITLAEAVASVDEVAGEYLQSIGSLPARITRDPRERQRIEAICDAERLRLSDRFVKASRDLRSGGSADEADDEDDA